ncbi:MAG: UDP-N-acetylmuramoyl-tripeptide--D-alanyl-D-alanine ligase [Bacilli bacterium]|nr:UDP-N-acetylmuramoyl-tripeptide--D-alanyl-D-alanine ligase [Bacilli bacterium]
MKIIINIELIINLFLLLLFYMHMFQLNSYFSVRYASWVKVNVRKVILRIMGIVIPVVILLLNNNVSKVISITLLAISILLNIPKNKGKIPLKFTGRVKRMFAMQVLLIVFVCVFGNTYLMLVILNILAFLLCVISNIINYPIEYFIRQYYINDAKKMIRKMPNLIVIGVTGSYGKTSVKNFLMKTLSAKYEVLATPKNYNTTMGVVKTIREELKPIHQIFICEMGAAKVGDIKEICDIVEPKYGVITSIGPQHLKTFKSLDNIIKTKYELYDAVCKNGGITFLNYDNEYISKKEVSNVLTYGIDNKELDYSAYNLKSSAQGLSFLVKDVLFKTKLIGRHNIVNIVGAIAVANYLGVPIERLVTRVREIKSVEHRLQLISRGNLNIIDDSYNSNPVSSKSALDTLSEFEGIKIIVTPGLIELGEDEEKYNSEFGIYMCDICDYIFIVNSTVSKYILKGINSTNFSEDKIFMVNSPQVAVEKIMNMNFSDKVTVLLENDLPDNYNL